MISEFCWVGWLSFGALSFEFFCNAFQTWLDLSEDGFGGFGRDAGSWMGTVALLAADAAVAPA